MTKQDQKQLEKALEMMKKAQSIINKLEGKNRDFRHDANAIFRTNRVNAAVSIMETTVRDFCELQAAQ